jgi:O-antigen ligase
VRDTLLLLATALIFGYAVFSYGAVMPRDQDYCMMALTPVAGLVWLTGRKASEQPGDDRITLWMLGLLLGFVALQVVPLPLALIRLLSPARAQLVDALAPVAPGIRSATLSVAPAATLAGLARLQAVALMYFVIRELGSRFSKRPWVVALPVIAVAVAESALGLVQSFGHVDVAATGTYVNRNHFACLLEMALPLALMLTFTALIRRRGSYVLRVCLSMGASGFILLGLLYSTSRMALVITCVSVAVLSVLAGLRGPGRALTLAGLAALLVLIIPTGLIERMSGSGPEPDGRAQIWRETGRLIADYPIFGCGFGAYSSAIGKYRRSMPVYLVDYAHNDYLQALAELGATGAIPLFGLGGLMLARAFRRAGQKRGASASNTSGLNTLAIGCAVSLLAIGLHGFVDFNFYIPANLLLAGWIAGMASALSAVNSREGRPA